MLTYADVWLQNWPLLFQRMRSESYAAELIWNDSTRLELSRALLAEEQVPSYCYVCVLILVYMCPHTAIYVASYLLYLIEP